MPSSKLEERKQRELAKRRKDILKVVRKMIARSGARDITMRKVAEESGFSNTVVYALFGDKATMITTALDDDLIRLHKLMMDAASGGKTALERIRLVCRAHVRNGLQHPDVYFLLFMEPRPAPPIETSTLTFGDPQHDPYAFVCDLIAQLAKEGHVAGDQMQQALMTQMIWEGVHGMTSLRIASGDDPWIERLDAEAHLELLLDVLLLGVVQRFPGPRSADAIKLLSKSARAAGVGSRN
ncbi:TetR/AcrR family transcriptional regulator [Variovorax dokdonensis]|uniref:TetR/AcrR family transcriptional regulator n=1 Tax=Variovorax dokdonensis TaxID=344883 RepID=A0ABT7NDP8_9BURK|nr:TetR/AcrR family transcriptional regulator [Variovorax dokdonensis]MDM0046077.1 TetR/AcrR family transcriptional regulator [Variovorax dokdonensis]